MLKSKYFTISLGLAIILLGFSFIRSRAPIKDLDAEIDYVNQKLAEAQRKNEYMAVRASSLQNESFLERQIKLKLNYKNSDEEAVLVYKVEPTGQTTQEQGNYLAVQYHHFVYWLDRIFGR